MMPSNTFRKPSTASGPALWYAAATRARCGGAEEGKQMRLARLALAALALLLVPFVAGAAPKKVVLLFTGDNGGEIAPCG